MGFKSGTDNLTSLSLSGDANGKFINVAHGSNGSNLALKVKETTGAVSGTTTTTTIAAAIPANSVIIACAIRVTTACGNGHVTEIGVTGDPNFFVDTDAFGGAGPANTLKAGTLEQEGDTAIFPWQPANHGYLTSASAQNILLTHGNTDAAAFRVAVYYYEITAPTS